MQRLQRQAADRPQALKVKDSEGLLVNGRIDFDALAMAIAGAMAGGP